MLRRRILCRHYKLEAELAEVNWRVRWDDIMFGAQEKRKLERSGSRLSLARVGLLQRALSAVFNHAVPAPVAIKMVAHTRLPCVGFLS